MVVEVVHNNNYYNDDNHKLNTLNDKKNYNKTGNIFFFLIGKPTSMTVAADFDCQKKLAHIL